MRRQRVVFLDTVEDVAGQDVERSAAASEAISDEELDRLIDAEAQAEHSQEVARLSGLRAELAALKQEGEQKRE
ncbi:MAG: hypothetical protein IT449_10180 [Phycisphaerales bacterium]|nr:hypothetical protein [Phycisphaerales bacterium]